MNSDPQKVRKRGMPFWMKAGILIAVVASWIPLALIALGRASTATSPRVQLMQDMGKQPKYRPQRASELFADGRAMRPKIAGTVARGQLEEDDHYERGFRLAADAAGGAMKPQYFTDLPPRLTANPVQLSALLVRGQERYNIFCATCHGLDGFGKGPVNQRAIELAEPRWVPAKSLHDADVRARAAGHLYNTINNGIRTMPPYGAQIAVEDRWAIVAYMRALQLSQSAPAVLVPPQKLESAR